MKFAGEGKTTNIKTAPLGADTPRSQAKKEDVRKDVEIDPLVWEVIAGKEEAFTALYHKYFDRVQRICFKIVKNTDTAMDVAQIVFAKLPEKIKSFKGDAAFSNWLYRVAMNETRMYVRKSLRKKTGTGREIVGLDAVSQDATISERFDTEETKMIDRIDEKIAIEKLDKVIEVLPLIYKTAYLLRKQGDTYNQIAQKLDISISVAQERVKDAIIELRRSLGLSI